MPETFAPTLAAARARMAAVRPAACARTRNALDGDLASNHLSWQWVAGTGSRKPYLFNADTVARDAPASWHSPDSVIDTSCEALDRVARKPQREDDAPPCSPSPLEPLLGAEPPAELGLTAPDATAVTGRDVWLVQPWRLGPLPAALPADTVVIGVFLADFHHQWWARTPRGLQMAADLLAVNEVPAW